MTKGKDINLALEEAMIHLIYAVKHDGRHKARLVAGGHLTETPSTLCTHQSYPSEASIVTFLSELNGCETWSTDVSVYVLEKYTQEKVYIVAGQIWTT
jgi:hypothetical protein